MLVGAVVFTFLSTWRRGRQIVLERTSEDRQPLKQFIAQLDPGKLPRVAGTAIYLAKHRETVPYSLTDNLRHNKVLHERIVLLTVATERVPYVAEAERMTLEPLGKGFTEMTLHFGFAEAPGVPRHSRRTGPSSRSILPRPRSSWAGRRRCPQCGPSCRSGARSSMPS